MFYESNFSCNLFSTFYITYVSFELSHMPLKMPLGFFSAYHSLERLSLKWCASVGIVIICKQMTKCNTKSNVYCTEMMLCIVGSKWDQESTEFCGNSLKRLKEMWPPTILWITFCKCREFLLSVQFSSVFFFFFFKQSFSFFFFVHKIYSL